MRNLVAQNHLIHSRASKVVGAVLLHVRCFQVFAKNKHFKEIS